MPWLNIAQLRARQFQCGYCGMHVANDRGYGHSDAALGLYLCPNCEKPTLIVTNFLQVPSPVPGSEVKHLPEQLNALYKEARQCCSVQAYTSAVLTCRKLLMNIAVNQGASEGLKFIEYVDYLASTGYIPPNGRGWVDHIRKKGNEATHEIALMKQADADELIAFTEMLLKFVYEFPSRVP